MRICKCGRQLFSVDESTPIECRRCASGSDCDRVARITQTAERTKRLKDWIAFLRIDGEQGLGDTVKRLKSLAGKRAIKDDLRRIERICGCEQDVAIQRLNEMHPYQEA